MAEESGAEISTDYLYRLILENASIGIFLANTDTTIKMANQKLCEILDSSLDKIAGHSFSEFVKEKDQSTLIHKFKTLEEGRSEILKVELNCKNRKPKIAELNLLKHPCGTIQAFTSDITLAVFSEKREKARSHILEMLSKNISLSDILHEIVYEAEKCSEQSMCSILLLDKGGKTFITGAAPSLPDFFNDAINDLEIGPNVGSCGAAAYSGKRVIAEDISTHPNWIGASDAVVAAGIRSSWSEPIIDCKGKVLGTFAIYQTQPAAPSPDDIEFIKQFADIAAIVISKFKTEEESNQIASMYQLVFESSNDAIMLISKKGIYSCNKQTLVMFGLQDETDIINHNPAEFSPKKQPNGRNSFEYADEKIKQAIKNGWSRFEWIHAKKSGEEFPTDVLLSRFEYENDWLVHATVRDITEQKKAEDALHKSKKQFESLIENISGVYWVNDLNLNKTLYISPSYETIFGRPCQAMMENPQDFIETIHPEDKEWVFEKSMNIANEQYGYFTYRILRADGLVRWISIKISVVTDESGKKMEYGYAEDVTEMKKATEEIIILNKSLETKVKERTAELEETNRELEMFSYSVSHDLQSPLRTISGFSELLQTNYREKLDTQGKEYLELIGGGVKNMHQMIHGLLHFAKLGKSAVKTTDTDMNLIVTAIVNELKRNELYKKTKFEINSLQNTIADSNLIKQVWRNLIENGAKYSSKKEQPVVEIGMKTIDGEKVYYVKDNGAGFDMKYAPKLFKVFKRLHGVDEFEGTGLGLANVNRIISKHGGKIWTEAKPGEGATFYFSLPQKP